MSARGLLRAVESTVRCNAELTIGSGRVILGVCELPLHPAGTKHKSGCTSWGTSAAPAATEAKA
jgi:hypothetical protein